jgi:hypothetical protein
MSIASRLNDQYVPLAVACTQVGYPPDRAGQRNLRQHLRRKGFGAQVRRVGNNFSIQIASWTAYLKRCEQDRAAHRALIGAQAKARWAAKHAEG